jgi:hypothetical protein
MDAIGYNAVDCGTLADSWRIEPNTPVYVLPYVGEPPAGLTKEERRRWFRADRRARVTADQVREFVTQAKKSARVGGHFGRHRGQRERGCVCIIALEYG